MFEVHQGNFPKSFLKYQKQECQLSQDHRGPQSQQHSVFIAYPFFSIQHFLRLFYLSQRFQYLILVYSFPFSLQPLYNLNYIQKIIDLHYQLNRIYKLLKMCVSRWKKKVWDPPTNRMTGFPVKFDEEQVQQLNKKFKKMAGTEKEINIFHFQKNMGIMGLQSVYGFSNRLFNSFDLDQDGKISFMDFIEYMEILKCGSEQNKALISYRLIDVKNKKNISIQDFRNFLNDYFLSWSSITNSSISQNFKEQTEFYVIKLFKKIEEETGSSQISFKYYVGHMYGKKDFMDAFSFISEGVAEFFIQQNPTNREALAHYQVLREIRRIYEENFKNNQSQKQKESQLIVNNKKKQEKKIHQTFFGGCSRSADKQQKSIFQKKQDQIFILRERLQRIQTGMNILINKTEEQYQILKQKYNKLENNQKLDLASIILNIPKQPYISKAQGKMILFGDQKWNLVLNMMIGIQMAVSSVRGYQELFFEQPQDFHLKYNFELVPRRFGEEKKTKRICQFTDYAPNTFNHIRKIFKINNNEYISSIGPNKLMKSLMMGQLSSLTELTSQGKSGSFFYYTTDGKYMLKTIQHREYKLMRSILKDYYFYLKQNPDSLLIKFYGLHRLHFESDLAQEDESGKIYFVIMGNIFNTKEKIFERYDIKGSTYGRTNKNENPEATKKDLDFLNKYPDGLQIHSKIRNRMVEILKKDADFLKSHQILDYSLLIGIYRKQKNILESLVGLTGSKNPKSNTQFNNFQQILISKSQGVIFGVIDILIQYDGRKAFQYYFKKTFQGEGVSAIPPSDYAQRFTQFIENKVFPCTDRSGSNILQKQNI